MKTSIQYLMVLALLFSVQTIVAQENNTNSEVIESLEEQKDKIVEQERSYLKTEVEAINKRLENGEILLGANTQDFLFQLLVS